MSKILDTIKHILYHQGSHEKIPSFTKDEWDNFLCEPEILISPYHEYPNPMVSLNADGGIWDIMFHISEDKTCVVITELFGRKEPESLPFDESPYPQMNWFDDNRVSLNFGMPDNYPGGLKSDSFIEAVRLIMKNLR